MYNDYPTVYESHFDSGIMTILTIVSLGLGILTIISISKIFKKANHSPISAWIPVYNILVLLEIVNLPKWYIALLFVPILNIIIGWKIVVELSHGFKKNEKFAIGLLILPFIYYPILAFGNSEYLGINVMAKEGTTTVTDIPDIDNKEAMDLTIHEEQDTSLHNINISIGGGVYQKDYTQNLIQADEKQTIKKKPMDLLPKVEKDTSNNSFIKDMKQEQQPKIKESESVAFQMPTILETSNDEKNNQNQNNCPKCGAQLKEGSTVCFLCGTHVGN